MPPGETRADGAGRTSKPRLAHSLLPAKPAPAVPEAWPLSLTMIALVLQVRPRPGCDSAAVAVVLLSYAALYWIRWLGAVQAGLPYVLQDSLSPNSLLHLERLAYEMGIIQHAPYQPPYPQGDLGQGAVAPAMLPQHQVRPSGLTLHAPSEHFSAAHPSGNPFQGAALPMGLAQHQIMPSCIILAAALL